MTLSNGALSAALLTAVPGTSQHLRPGASAGFVAARAAVLAKHGWTPGLTDGYRTYAEQVALFTARYTTSGPTAADRVGKSWQGRRWYRRPGYAAAATPGTSNHGWGLAADVSGLGASGSTRWAQWAVAARPLGWSNAEGASIGEPWHWVWTGPAETVDNPLGGVGGVATAPTLNTPAPVPVIEEFDMITLSWSGKTYTAGIKHLKHHANNEERAVSLLLSRQSAPLALSDDDMKRAIWCLGVPVVGDPIRALNLLTHGGQIG